MHVQKYVILCTAICKFLIMLQEIVYCMYLHVDVVTLLCEAKHEVIESKHDRDKLDNIITWKIIKHCTRTGDFEMISIILRGNIQVI